MATLFFMSPGSLPKTPYRRAWEWQMPMITHYVTVSRDKILYDLIVLAEEDIAPARTKETILIGTK